MTASPRTAAEHQAFAERSSASAAFAAFNRATHSHRQLMMRKVAEHHVHQAQMFCIKALSAHDGITQRDLAELLNVSRPTVTVMLQKMQKAGLVERRVDEKDQRYTRIFLTQEGWAIHEQMHDILEEIVAVGIGPMTEKDQRDLARLLGILGDNIQDAIEAMPPPGALDNAEAPTSKTTERKRPSR